MAKVAPISGFPEWLPEQRLVEERVYEQIRSLYRSFGFVPIETPAVELLSTLVSKGSDDREIYAINRHQAIGEGAEFALHFDLTVPLARYVAQHAHQLSFPFKRYQMQKVWRGERPQRGRYREFYQCDIDIVGREELPLAADGEILAVLDTAFATVNFTPHVVRINHRKLLQGLYRALGLNDERRSAAIRVVDKIRKIGNDGVLRELTSALGVEESVAQRIVALATLEFPVEELRERVMALGLEDELVTTGVAELGQILSLQSEATRKRCVIDMSLARGLEYYTGIIIEVHLPQFPDFGSAGGGGRYENLVGQFSNQKFPGVGGSFGLTRYIGLAFEEGLVPVPKPGVAQVLVTVLAEEGRAHLEAFARELRSAGVATEVFLGTPKLGKQIEYAERRGVRWVVFQSGNGFEVKDLASKTQVPTSAAALIATIGAAS